MFKKLNILAATLFGIIAGSLITWQITSAQANSVDIPIETLRIFAEVFEYVNQGYVKKPDEKKLWTSAIKGMVSSLDPHSSYLDEKEYQELKETTQGQFAGLGIKLVIEDGALRVITAIEGTPAFRAGIQPGDLIIKIGEKFVRNMPMQKAINSMRGKAGTKLKITIHRRSDNKIFDLAIRRAIIREKSVSSNWLNSDIVYMRITSFQQSTTRDCANQLKKELNKKNLHPKGLILDLRNNGGGLLQSAIGVASIFLPQNAVIVKTNGQLPEAKQIFLANPKDYLFSENQPDPLLDLPLTVKNIPIIVLVNAYSASASEIVAGALQDYNRATIIGKTTFGKGSVQTVRPVSDKTAIRLTTAYYFTPKNRSIQNTGILPDLIVDHFADGDPDDVLTTREVDLQNHLSNLDNPNEEIEHAKRERLRLEKIKQYEEKFDRMSMEQRQKERKKLPPEFGNPEKDFMLQQAINFFNAQTIKK